MYDSEDDAWIYQIKVVIGGSTGSGKTSLIKRACKLDFSTLERSTIGIDFLTLEMNSLVDQRRRYRLQIWDTAGQERFRAVNRTYYREAIVVLFVYDCTSAESFQQIPMWLQDAEWDSKKLGVQGYLIANKIDLETKTFQSGRELAQQYNLHYVETSALTRENLDTLFERIRDRLDETHSCKQKSKLSLDTPLLNRQESKTCCQ